MKTNKTEDNKTNNIERVKVYIRIRPFNDSEKKLGGDTPFKSVDLKNNVLSIKADSYTKVYAYDGIYDENSTQEQVFNVSAKTVIDVREIKYNKNSILKIFFHLYI